MNKRRLLVLAGLAALAIVVMVNLGYINQFVKLLRQVRWYVFPLVIAIQGLSYYANAKYYQTFFDIFNYHIQTGRLYRAALAINFVNQVFPSGGVSGASFLARELDGDVPAGKATLAQLVRYIFTFISFLAVLAVGVILLLVGGDLNQITVRLTLLFLLVIVVVALLLVTVAADRQRVEVLALRIIRPLNRLVGLFRRRRRPLLTDAAVGRFFDEFYGGYHLLLEEKGHWRRPLLYALAGNVAEVATVYVVFLAFGAAVNPGIAIAAYTLANIVSLAAFVTSGVGVYEAAMITAFVALGVPLALAISVTVVYRVLNLALYLPPGFYFYRQSL
ncbi:flippase-like domain-containing protein [Candidatus Parcubacteria bacterium]|nr:flippase-like domain-containing protein [Candidatus Parcubacteria bacterium]